MTNKCIPEPGITTKADVIQVSDGDTIKVQIIRTFDVRIRGLMCAEHNTPKGKEEKAFLTSKIGKEVTIFIPSNDSHKLMDMNSFNRLIGDVWFSDGTNLAEFMDANGMGRLLKSGEKPHEGE